MGCSPSQEEQERTTGENRHPAYTTPLGLPSHVPKAVRKAYVDNPGVKYRGIRIEPLDLVFVRGTSFASKISRFLQRNSGCNDVSTSDDFFDLAGEFSHIGMIVTSDILDHPKVVPGKLYIWESTQGGGADIDGGEHTGTQLRDFMKVTDAVIADDDEDYGVAVGKLREDVRKNIDYAEAKKTFNEFYDVHNLAPYDFNILDLADAVHAGPSVDHDDTKLFCSQLIAKTFKALKIIPPDVHDARVLPMDFLGFDKDKEVPVLVHHPYFIAGTRPACPKLAASMERSTLAPWRSTLAATRLQNFVRPKRSEAMLLQSVSSSAFMAEATMGEATAAAEKASEEVELKSFEAMAAQASAVGEEVPPVVEENDTHCVPIQTPPVTTLEVGVAPPPTSDILVSSVSLNCGYVGSPLLLNRTAPRRQRLQPTVLELLSPLGSPTLVGKQTNFGDDVAARSPISVSFQDTPAEEEMQHESFSCSD